MDIITQKCTKCKIEKPLSEFSKSSRNKNGIVHQCRECVRLYYLKNQDKIRARVKAYCLKFPEKKKARDRAYALKNKEAVARNQARYNLRKPHVAKERSKRWALENKDKRTASWQFRKNRINAGPNSWWVKDPEYRKKIEEFYKNRPAGFHVDHILPINGDDITGLHVLANLQYLPEEENLKKGNSVQIEVPVGECHQFQRRIATEEDDRKNKMPFDCDLNEITFSQEIGVNSEIRLFIEKYEWLGTIGYRPRYVFSARYRGILAGVVLIDTPTKTQFDRFLPGQECQIHRGAAASWAPKNLNSKLVMFAIREMVRNTHFRIFTAYVDPEAGEVGTIYQACNFKYLGLGYGGKKKYQRPDGKWVTNKGINHTYEWKKAAKNLGIEWQPEWCGANGYKKLKNIPSEVKNSILSFLRNDRKDWPSKYIPSKGKYVLFYPKNRAEKEAVRTIFSTTTFFTYPKRGGTLKTEPII